MHAFDSHEWLLLYLAALFIGFSKTGIGGMAGLSVAIFANVLPSKESTGAVLPLLICADIIAVQTYRKQTIWKHIISIAPWTILGVFIGYFLMKYLDDAEIRKSIGVILLVLTVFHILRQSKNSSLKKLEQHKLEPSLIIALGLFTGITTMVANAAGPIFAIYLLSLKLPKMEYMGTGAWFFFLLNSMKVPFSYHLGLINPGSLRLNLFLSPAVILGALCGRWVIQRINQQLFEWLALAFTILAGIRLLM
jgi:uncharacterized membrane protein YfcA